MSSHLCGQDFTALTSFVKVSKPGVAGLPSHYGALHFGGVPLGCSLGLYVNMIGATFLRENMVEYMVHSTHSLPILKECILKV